MSTWLVASVGERPRPRRYLLPDGQTIEAVATAPVALQVLGGIDYLAVLSTAEALDRATWLAALSKQGMDVRRRALPEEALDDPWTLLVEVLDLGFQPGDVAHFELTAGPRALGLAFVSAAVMLQSVHGCAAGEVLVMSTLGEVTQVRRYGELISSARWASGIGAVLGGGPVEPLAQIAASDKQIRGRGGTPWIGGAGAADGLGRLADALAVVNVPEVLRRPLLPVRDVAEDTRGAVQRRIFDAAVQGLASLSPHSEAAGDHLEAQLRLVERYLSWSDPLRAGLVLREWLVNRVLAAGGAPPASWTDRSARQRAEGRLHAAPAEEPPGRLWDQVGQLRNVMAHAGFSPHAGTKAGLATLRRRLDAWLNLVKQCRASLSKLGDPLDPFRLRLDDHHVLVLPLGLSRDVLRLARIAAEDAARTLDGVLVVTSSEVAEALSAALEPTLTVAVMDPFRPPAQLQRCLDELYRRELHEAGRVTACLTGGSTLLGFAVAGLADRCRRGGAEVRSFVLDAGGAGHDL